MSATVICTYDNHAYSGRSPEEAIQAMARAGVLTASKSLEEYMAMVQRQVLRLHGQLIRTDSADEFLTDLADLGVITLKEIH